MTFDKDRAAAVREAINETISTIKGDYTINAPAEVKVELIPHLKDLLVLERNLLATVGVACSNDSPREGLYRALWSTTMDDMQEAMEIVQNNQGHFHVTVGADKLKVVSEFFVKWAKEKGLKP